MGALKPIETVKPGFHSPTDSRIWWPRARTRRLVALDLGSQREEGEDAVRAGSNQRPGEVAPDDATDAPQVLALERLDHLLCQLLAAGEAAEAVDVDDDEDVAAAQRVAEVAGPALGRRLVPVAALGQVLQELAPHARFGGGHLALLDQGHGHHGGGVLHRHESDLLRVRRMVEHGDVTEDLVGGIDRGDDPLPVHAEPREGGHLHRTAMGGDLAQHALDAGVEEHPRRGAVAGDRLPPVLVDVRAAGVGEEVEGRVLDHDRAAEQFGQRPRDLIQALAVEDQLGETAMDRDRLLQPGVLGIDDPLQQRLHQVHPGDVLAEGEERQVEAVGLLRHPLRQSFDVHPELDDEARSADLGDRRHQLQLRGRVVADGVGGCQQQVAGPGPARGLRCLDDPDPLDSAVEAAGAGHQVGGGKAAEAHRLAHRGSRDQPVGGLDRVHSA